MIDQWTQIELTKCSVCGHEGAPASNEYGWFIDGRPAHPICGIDKDRCIYQSWVWVARETWGEVAW